MDKKFYILQIEPKNDFYNKSLLNIIFILNEKPLISCNGYIIAIRKDSVIKYKGEDLFIMDRNENFIIMNHEVIIFEEYSDLNSIDLLYSL